MIIKSSQFQHAVLRWFAKHGRKNLPWQKNPIPYRVWISEIMLQQTQVVTVIPYFQRFMQYFPTLKKLSAASEDQVLHLWTGLGYYSRARNLLKTAKIIQAQYKGKFPHTINELITLPGIGRSTAGAILALSMQVFAPILDGNVKRVLSRVHAENNQEVLWKIAESYTPKKHIAEYTQAMMDLGAMICTRTKPQCESCPLKKYCVAYARQQQSEFPGKKIKKALPVRQTQLLLLRNAQGEILLEKRPSHGIWASLWSLPEYDGAIEIKEFCQKNYACQVRSAKKQTPFRHTFSHFHLDITPMMVEVTKTKSTQAKNLVWYNVKRPKACGLPAPIKNLLLQC